MMRIAPVVLIFLVCVLAAGQRRSATSEQRSSSVANRAGRTSARLPRVGTIKDYPATGLMTGCGNLYFHFAQQANHPGAAYVFISRARGADAWMNLDGRDVRLRQIKAATRVTRTTTRYLYRFGRWRISVRLAAFKPESAAPEDFTTKMSITLRQGRATRTVRALGYADC